MPPPTASDRSRWQRNDSPARPPQRVELILSRCPLKLPENEVVAPVRGIGTGATTSSGKERLRNYRGQAPSVSRTQASNSFNAAASRSDRPKPAQRGGARRRSAGLD